MKRNLWTGIAVLIVVLSTASTLHATGKGANPNGKPFVELLGQIIEVEGEMATLQDQIESIVGRVDSMEARIAANENAVVDLSATNLTLQAQLDANAGDIAALLGDIEALEMQNATLQDQVDSNQGDIEALEGQIAYNNGLISAMQQSLSELGTTLQDQIDNNATLITALQAEVATLNDLLALKELLDNSECPTGEAFREVLPDGSVICESIGSDRDIVYARKGGALYPGQHGTVKAYCPTGYHAVGGGFDKGWWISVVVNGVTSYGTGNAWQVRFVNNYSTPATNFTTAVCLGPMN